MSEQAAAGIDKLNLNIDTYNAYSKDGLKGLIRTTEVQVRQDRTEAVSTKGWIGSIEKGLRFLGAELGFGQLGKEKGAFNEHVGKSESQIASLFETELKNKSAKEQAKFLSAGMESVEKGVLKLMEVRAKGVELEAGGVSETLARIGKEFMEASNEDIEATNAFFEGMQNARGETLTTMSKMWDAKNSLDIANTARAAIDVGREISHQDQYRFEPESGVIYNTQRALRRLASQVGVRLGRVFKKTGEITDSEVDNYLSELRTKTLRVGGVAEDIQMWRKGIISRSELGPISLEELKEKKVKLSSAEIEALQKDTDLPQFMKQVRNAPKGTLAFDRVNQHEQCSYFEEFYGGKLQPVLNVDGKPKENIDGTPMMQRVGGLVRKLEFDFNTARDNYLQFDLGKSSEWDAQQGLIVKTIRNLDSANIDTDALGAAVDILTIPVPQLVKKWATYFPSVGTELMLSIARVPGEAVHFEIDNMESMLAAHGLEQLIPVMLARESAITNLQAMLKKDGSQNISFETIKAALAVRGAEQVMYSADLYVQRIAETIDMTYGKGTFSSIGNALGSAPRAAIEGITGGIFTGESINKTLSELQQRGNLLNGKEVASKHKELAKEVAGIVDSVFGNEARSIGIPEEYMTDESLAEHLKSSWHRKLAEWTRKQVGEEGQLFGLDAIVNWVGKKVFKKEDMGHLRDTELWQVIAGGSKSQSVETIKAKYGNSYVESITIADGLAKELASSPESNRTTEQNDLAVEAATALLTRDAKQAVVTVEMNQILKRKQLNDMWSRVFDFVPRAAVLTTLGVLVAHNADQSIEIAKNWLTKSATAADNLSQMQTAYDTVMKTAQEQGMHMTQGGAKMDLAWLDYISSSTKDIAQAASWTAKNYLEIKLASLSLAMLAPIAAVAPGAYELLANRKVHSKFLGQTGEIK